MRLAWLDELDSLPPAAKALLEGRGFFSSATWYGVVARHGLPSGTAARFALASSGERPVALFPLRVGPAGVAEGLTTPYTCVYQPLLAPDATPAEVAAACRAVVRRCRGGLARFDALPEGEASCRTLAAGARRAGLVPLWHDHFAAWQDVVEGLDWPAYLARRPGELRGTLARKERQHGRALTLRLVQGGAGLEPGIAAYQAVYDRSWKPEEPFPAFNPALMRAAAACGALRLGLLLDGDEPVAAQLWVVWDRHATVLKLAHDASRDALSPGTLLTARMIALLLHEGVRAIDFGRGDDPYKRRWAGVRTMRVGLVLADPLRPAGLAALLCHAAGRLRRGWALDPPGGRIP